MVESSKKVTEWVQRLSEEDFPLFAHTARSIASLSSTDDASIQELAQVILGDNAMTARVLRMANSAYYNPANQRINTVSRAIVLLGFEAVRSISLTISLIDTILTGDRHDAALGEMVKSYHAAIQAKGFSAIRRALNAEEIFIAALLNRLGPVAFWCFPYGKDAELVEAYRLSASQEDAEKEVLGFTLEQLTSALTREWHLSTMLMGALRRSDTRDKNIKSIEYGFRIANELENGWDAPEIKQVIGEISEDLNQTRTVVKEVVFENAKKAASIIEKFGIKIAGQFIPPPPFGSGQEGEAQGKNTSEKEDLQLDILRELSTMLSEQADLNVVLGTVLEGIYRSLDMERVVLSLISKDKKMLSAKFAIGERRTEFVTAFKFSLDKKENVFTHILELNEALWLDRKKRTELGPLLTPEIHSAIGLVEFFAIPIRVGGKAIGIIYADRSLKCEPLDEHRFLTFRHFCEQASIAFAILGR